MRLSEILSEDRILVPLEAETLEEAIGLLQPPLHPGNDAQV